MDQFEYLSVLISIIVGLGLIPIGVYVLSYLVVPDLEGEEVVDLRASYYASRPRARRAHT